MCVCVCVCVHVCMCVGVGCFLHGKMLANLLRCLFRGISAVSLVDCGTVLID